MKLRKTGTFTILGKLLSADLDADGNLHVIIRNSDRFWAKASTRYLRQLKNKVLEFEVREWERKTGREPYMEGEMF